MAYVDLLWPTTLGQKRSLSSYTFSSATDNNHINHSSPVCPAFANESNKTLPTNPAASVSYTDKSSEILSSRYSLLYPPSKYKQKSSGSSIFYEIKASELVNALEYISKQPLPNSSLLFPWLHGLHPNNQIFSESLAETDQYIADAPPICYRGITLVKADGDLSHSKLKGAIPPEVFLDLTSNEAKFLKIEPQHEFSARNFHIQAAKMATVSDVVLYGDDKYKLEVLAVYIFIAQQRWRSLHYLKGYSLPEYNTFICTCPFKLFELIYPHIVAIDSQGTKTGKVLDLPCQEEIETRKMTRASEIDKNVWLGPTPDPTKDVPQPFDIIIECSDLGRCDLVEFRKIDGSVTQNRPAYLKFPSGDTISENTTLMVDVLEVCKWIYYYSHGALITFKKNQTSSSFKEILMRHEKKILIHCADGHTESSFLGLSYLIYATGLPVSTVLIDLHVSKGRNFYAHPSEVALLTKISPQLLSKSPSLSEKSDSDILKLIRLEPEWFKISRGSLPSRITDFMYLGDINHANNPSLLSQMGIGQILSIGETVSWNDKDKEKWINKKIVSIPMVRDNGLDSLIDDFERCLDFINHGRIQDTATLVHCRVGVSRSATICIAEIIKSQNLSFPQAYCFVRARRLNIIIQPNLRFAYELLKWEEKVRQNDCSRAPGRELEWSEIATEIATINKSYTR